MGGKSGKIQRGASGLAAVLAVCLMVCCAGEARAATVDYTLGDSAQATSVIWSDGGPLSNVNGTSIAVKDVVGFDTPANAGTTLPFSDALLSFTSGTYSGSNGNLYTYKAGGTFSVIGSFDFNSNGSYDSGETGVTLMSGTVGALTLDKSNSSQYRITNTALSVTDYALAAYFGYPANTIFNGIMNLAFNIGNIPEEFQGGGTTGDISTSPVTTPVPAAALLMFSGLAGLFGFRRKTVEPTGEAV